MGILVTIIHGGATKETKHKWSLAALPRHGDTIFLDGFKSGVVKAVEFHLADEKGFAKAGEILVRIE